MYVESVTLQNFRSFGDRRSTITFDSGLTAFIGTNGTGKTAACQALQRVFGITSDERTVRLDDFHVSSAEARNSEPESRTLTIDLILAFPELEDESGDHSAVPNFFRRAATGEAGNLKCRIVLKSTWTADGTVDGNIETQLFTVASLEPEYTEDEVSGLPPAERSRIQFVYVPASRDGAKQISAFLRGRLWRAATWSSDLEDTVSDAAERISAAFHKEAATRTVEDAFARRWRELHGAGTHATPRFQPLEPDLDQFLRGAELTFEPDPSSLARPARLLSDGQRSLLYLALTTASLDLEQTITSEPDAGFDRDSAFLPTLTLLAIEEPENSLSPYYLSRIVGQMLDLGASATVQVLLSSHSASTLGRISPSSVRHFRLDAATGESIVRPIRLPQGDTEAGTYVREAVRAHPELYFARFVVLGEGDSEHIVIPAMARALGLDFDPSFVAMVPLGGRHTHHFWKLLTELEIPHATLIDLDYGRSGGGAGRLRTALTNLQAVGINVLDEVDNYDDIESLTDGLTLSDLRPVRDKLREFGVFFSSPLDLDMLMLRQYWDAYVALEEGQQGPQSTDATKTVLGTGGTDNGRKYWEQPTNSERRDERQEELRWYRYLFSNRSKPATHLTALSRLTSDEKAKVPPVLKALVEFVNLRLMP